MFFINFILNNLYENNEFEYNYSFYYKFKKIINILSVLLNFKNKKFAEDII